MNFKGIIKGLHHITATVNDAQEDYDFYTKLLGQRLIKETVNFDNENVYHFYYGNEIGAPSTIFTTFPYKGQGVRNGVIGSGQVFETVFSAPGNSMDFWEKRLETNGINFSKVESFGKGKLQFKDPSGLNLAIIEDADDKRTPVWKTEDISDKENIIGIHHVVLAITEVDETLNFLKIFGYEETTREGDFVQLNSSIGGAGNSLVVMDAGDLPKGKNGIGTVHHVAHRVEKLEDSLKIRDYLIEELGLKVTEVKDRKYFESIYFRIPGGVLFEVATEGPGFLVDETNEELGNSLKLPDWQEPHRAKIEAGLIDYKK
ncbi:ring-cleaving dioxygenase [Marivirga salinae]|uniref:Ring-cleaving dioxygenase n=1 Tax=Marivirga salinarum TaxID=3059078 RepID=A0AA51NA39_9BACT|nr:ring-cleaving dioxygenase [Marivirga sp. BDSF4-3]WMN11472.1 ring-cleaving dioxygenase [Marivirga sp. BDSF4-3]